jgi:hypothetical protein
VRREQALAILDALIVDGFNATLNVWHGQSIEKATTGINEPKPGPIYDVTTGPRDQRSYKLDDLRQLGDIAENVGATVVVDGGGDGRTLARFHA